MDYVKNFWKKIVHTSFHWNQNFELIKWYSNNRHNIAINLQKFQISFYWMQDLRF